MLYNKDKRYSNAIYSFANDNYFTVFPVSDSSYEELILLYLYLKMLSDEMLKPNIWQNMFKMQIAMQNYK